MRPHTVLEFWFGDADPRARVEDEVSRRWFKKSAAFDEALSEQFGDITEAAMAGELDQWSDTEQGQRALILVLDQFTRNMYRATERAFAGDAIALELAASAIARGADRHLGTPQAAFLYMPYMHSENLHHQNGCVALFEALAARRDGAENNVRFARAHREVILKFGRFPHRNAALGRTSTSEELAYLGRPGSGF